MDISKLKVPDLKKELKTRGLNTSGNKNELVERLQAALKSAENTMSESVDDLEEDLLNEDDDDEHLERAESVMSDLDTALSDTIPVKGQKRKISDDITNGENQPPAAPKKVVLNRNTPIITDTRVSTESKEESDKGSVTSEDKRVIKLSTLSAKERLEMRANKFGVTLSTEARKVARAERFGVTSKDSKSNSGINTKVNTNLDVLKQRAERFGGSVSKAMSSLEVQERLEKRKARFGIVSNNDKAKQRLERFKQPVK